jgi:hypothetical protein
MLTGNRILSQPVITIDEIAKKSLSRMTNDAIATPGIDVAANVFPSHRPRCACRHVSLIDRLGD